MEQREAWSEGQYLYCTAATVDSVTHGQLDLKGVDDRVGALCKLKLVFVETVSESDEEWIPSGPHALARATTREGGQSAVARLSPTIGGRLAIGHTGYVRVRRPTPRELLLRDGVREDLVEAVVAALVALLSFVAAVVSMRASGGERVALVTLSILVLCLALGVAIFKVKRLLDN